MSDKDILDQLNFDRTDKNVTIVKKSPRHLSVNNPSASYSDRYSRGKHRGNILTGKSIVNTALIILASVLLLALLFLVIYIEGISHTSVDTDDSLNEDSIVVDHKIFKEEVDIISGVAKLCYEMDEKESVSDVVKYYRNEGYKDFDKSHPVVLEHVIRTISTDEVVEGYIVELSEKKDFSKSKKYSFSSEEDITLGNLKTNTRYYYKVIFEGVEYEYTGEFETSDTPRLLTIDGIRNVRDIGNWKTSDGRRIKQGLLYRGTELDGLVEEKYKLTEAGKKVMLEELGIVYDLDLRSSADNPDNISGLGDSVTRKYYNCPMYTGIFEDYGKSAIKEIFTDLANPQNYPMYLHCTYGQDRTGTVCFLLETLLGVSAHDTAREYELSALVNSALNLDELKNLISAIEDYEGSTTQEKVENYLLDCGITMEQIESIRDIFLDDGEEVVNN